MIRKTEEHRAHPAKELGAGAGGFRARPARRRGSEVLPTSVRILQYRIVDLFQASRRWGPLPFGLGLASRSPRVSVSRLTTSPKGRTRAVLPMGLALELAPAPK